MFVTLLLGGQHQMHILSFLFTLILVKVINLTVLWPLENYSGIAHVLVTQTNMAEWRHLAASRRWRQRVIVDTQQAREVSVTYLVSHFRSYSV